MPPEPTNRNAHVDAFPGSGNTLDSDELESMYVLDSSGTPNPGKDLTRLPTFLILYCRHHSESWGALYR
jgi:hypothetical protein